LWNPMKLPPPAVDEMDDDALIQEVQAGKTESFEQLLDRHVHHIRTFLALKAPAPHLIDELAHETFVFAFRNIESFEPGTSAQAWLRAIAWNLLRAETQRFSREQANQARFVAQRICEDVDSTGEPTSSSEVEFLERCLERVPPSLRELLILKYEVDCPCEE